MKTYFKQKKYKELFFGKYFGIPKNFILLLIIIGVVFGICGLAKITIFGPKIVADRTGQYLFKTVNIKEFKAGFGIQRETPNIVFQRNGTEIVIELPSRNMIWEKTKKGVQAQSQGYAYEYSILKDEKRKPVGIKEEIVLEQPLHLSHFVFPITLKNLEPKQVKGVWRFFNVSGIEQFYIPELFMEDANGETSQDIEIEVNTEAGFIKITPSRQWLDDIDRAYPVIIDSSIRIHQQTQEEKDLPNIINAYVDPIKVVPGDTMFVYAEIIDSHGISEVIADMGGIETINLELKQGTIYNGTWQAEWLVHDTGPRDYTTIITATNKLGKSSSASIEWLDPSWLAGWDNRIKFTIDHTKVDDDLSHFPVTVFLDSTQGEEVFAELDNDNDYDQVAFTKDDGVTELYAEKELFAHLGNYTSQYPPEQSDTYVKATTYYSSSYYPYYATDPTKSLTGTHVGNSWHSNLQTTNQRFHIDLGSAKIIKRIYYENMHVDGINTDRGAKDFTFWGSNTGAGTFDDLVYANDEGWTELTCSQNTFDRHSEADEADPKYITVTNSTAYRYYAFKFADNYTDPNYLGVRRIELQTEEEKGIYHISKTGWEISSSTDTDFYMYYDNDHADNTDYIGAINTTAGASVWDSNYEAVYHMVDDTTSAIKDSTSNNNDGTKLSANNPIEATGKVGNAQTFSSDYMTHSTFLDVMPDDLTVEACIKLDILNTDQYIFLKQNIQGEDRIALNVSSDNKIKIWGEAQNGGPVTLESTGTVTTATWYYIAGVHTHDSALKVYLDTAEDTGNVLGNILDGTYLDFITGSSDTIPSNSFDGIIDELRFSSTPRTAAWLKGTYNSLWDTLLTYGTEEEYVHPVPADFANRIKLTIDHTKIDSTLTHFPITVILSSTHGDSVFDHLASDANRFKIAFTESDGSTQLYGEIEKWDDASESAVIHVSRSGWEISSSADTDFYMYYDSSLNDNFAYIGDINSTPGESVWDSNFKLAQHMDSSLADSTSNNQDLTNNGTTLIDSSVGKARRFVRLEEDYLQNPYKHSQDFTITTKIKFTDIGSGDYIHSDWSAAYRNYMLYIQSEGKLSFASGNGLTSEGSELVSDTAMKTNDEFLVTFVRNGTTGYIYLNGVEDATASVGYTSNATVNASHIGTDYNTTWSDCISADIDEWRQSNIVRSVAWIKGTYNSLWDTLLTYGNEEAGTAPSISEFDNRIKFTIDHDKIDSTLTHFPVTVILSSTHGEEVFAELTSDDNRFKIAFTKDDESTQLYGEIEKWDDANESAVIHVSASGWEISSSADTNFYMYYDKDVNNNTNTYIGDIDTTAGHSVWDSNFKMVQHMVDETTSAVKDSTSNNNDGAKKAANEPIVATGKIGQGQDFDGGDDEIDLDTHAGNMPTVAENVTVEAVVNWGITPALHEIIVSYGGHVNNDGWMLAYDQNDDAIVFVVGATRAGIIDPTSGNWYHTVGRYDHSNIDVYINGASQGTTTYSTNIVTATTFRIGSEAGRTYMLDGIIDEVRVSNTDRSATWINATYNTLWDSLLTYGTQEDNTAPTAPNTLYSNNANAQAGKENPTGITDTTPVFSAVYNDPDAGDIANKYRIQVATSSDFATTSIFWDSGSSGVSMSNCVQGDRCQDVEYASTTVLGLDATKYYWRIKFWDGGTGWDGTEEGAWSTETAHFTMAYRELDTSTNANTLRSGADRHTFYDGTNYWAFYIDDNSHIVYEKSSDGTTWNGAVTEIATSTTYTCLGIWEDDTYIWTSYNSATTAYNKRITILDGTLGTEYSTSTADRYHPQIIKDSAGYLWRKQEAK